MNNWKQTKSQSGFTALHLLLILALLGIIGFAGWKVYETNKFAKPAESSAKVSTTKQPDYQTAQAKIPDGWVEYKNQELGFKFAYPKGWTIKDIRNTKNSTTEDQGLPALQLKSDDFQEDEASFVGNTKTGALFIFYAIHTDKEAINQSDIKNPDGYEFYQDVKNLVVDGVPALDYFKTYEGPTHQILEFIHHGLDISFSYQYKDGKISVYDQKYLNIRRQIIDTIKFL